MTRQSSILATCLFIFCALIAPALAGQAPLSPWTDERGRPTQIAREALDLLSGSAREGLPPGDYQADELRGAAALLDSRAARSAAEAERFGRTLNAELVRFLHDLHSGRVSPQATGITMAELRAPADVAASLATALHPGGLAALAESLVPSMPQYRRLRQELARYRALSARGLEPPPAAARVVHAGDEYADAPALAAWLVALGDLDAEAVNARPVVYDDVLAEAIRRFQSRHGLADDGVIGPRTSAALRVPLVQRIEQLELAMERLRWLPDVGDERLVALNIPMFTLWAWDQAADESMPRLTMKVVVGRAERTETPVLQAEMREVIFRPFWNVPPSIQRGELVPLIARDPAYLTRQDMEIVRGDGDDAPVESYSPEALAGLRAGRLRLRQRPGPGNALGLVKFVFPNRDNIYMHGTPARQLFALPRRDFSHGCVRVEDPTSLAEWVLEETPGWDRDRIEASMNGTTSIRVALGRPIRVVLFYNTAVVAPDDGRLRFADDVYGYDAGLARALRERKTSRPE